MIFHISKGIRMSLIVLLLLLLGPLFVLITGKVNLDGDWQTADRTRVNIAPDPLVTKEAVVQVYVARAFNWRGLFAVHPWIAVKPQDATNYTIYQVIGWNKRRGLSVVSISEGFPDKRWFGNDPEIIVDMRGEEAAAVIPEVAKAAVSYPYPDEYHAWPGPNSNTFAAYIGRQVPSLGLNLPVTAIGKDYLVNNQFVARTPSDTGYQISLYGLLGATLAKEEGVEFNLLALSFGLDVIHPALKLPGIGRVGWSKNHHSPSSSSGFHSSE